MKIRKPTFSTNKLTTTVGANGLADEAVVSQPRIPIPVVEEVEYEFDQKKFEEYLSSSSRSSSPRKSKMISAARKIHWASDEETEDSSPVALKVAGSSVSPAPRVAEFADAIPSMQEVTTEAVPTLSKRARQRRRQAMARRMAKAMQSMDGVRYEADLRSRTTPRLKSQIVADCSKPAKNEWVRVKRNRSTLEERIRKRRALLAQARALVQEARKLKKAELEKKPPKTRQVWRPKSGSSTESLQSDLKKVTPAPRPPPAASSKSPANAEPAPVKPASSSRSKKTVLEHLGLLQDDRGKALLKERLGPFKRSRTNYGAGGRIHQTPALPRTGLRIEVQEPVETSRPQRRTLR